MKTFILYLLSPLCLLAKQTFFVKSTSINKHSIVINFADSSFIKCKIKNIASKNYFNLNGANIYLDVDEKAVCIENIDSLLKANTIRPKYVSPYLPIIYLVFFVDENGNVLFQGLDRNASPDDYQKEFERLITVIKPKFKPAIVNGKKVACVLKYNIDYYKLFD